MTIGRISRISQISTPWFFLSSPPLLPISLPKKSTKTESEDIEKITDPTDLTDPPVAMAAASLQSLLDWSIDPHHSAVHDIQIKLGIRGALTLLVNLMRAREIYLNS
jgi:hypothetical protein